MKRQIILLSLAAALIASSASAQNTVPNPLRPAPERKAETPKAKVAAAPATEAPKPDVAKPKRERSAKQKQGDEDMRSCGTSWRNDKDALKAKGETWRTYLKSCRAQLKSSRGA
jgi:hypothetical protein